MKNQLTYRFQVKLYHQTDDIIVCDVYNKLRGVLETLKFGDSPNSVFYHIKTVNEELDENTTNHF